MKTIVTLTLGVSAAAAGLAAGVAAQSLTAPDLANSLQPSGAWATDSIWYDGLVEKATYDATKVIYGKSRSYEATFLTNKEQHDTATWTKANGSSDTVEVWKHNQIEVVPTPNYEYKFITTSHATVDGLSLTRMDATSQEWCGTTFHQYLREDDPSELDGLSYFGFSYMPEQGRSSGEVSADAAATTIAFNSLPLVLRGYDFDGRGELSFRMLPDQKSNKLVPYEPVDATVTYAGETDEGHKLTLTANGEAVGTFVFAGDRRHVMLSYEGANGDSYTLTNLDRVNYWTINE